jgi:hypothetical protein
MPSLPLPKYGLSNLHLFPYYQTREDFRKATGLEPPAFDPEKPPKYWLDTEIVKTTKRNVVYDQVLVVSEEGTPIAGSDGQPALEPLVLTRSEAIAVNIPYKSGANELGADQPEVQPPLRDLEADEELFFDVAGIVAVRNKRFYDQTQVGFTEQDRSLLTAIAKKLNVTL